ncbi:MAG: hypothetical protein ACKERG_00945 [Candidatus Hodgkinia cicadicola]
MSYKGSVDKCYVRREEEKWRVGESATGGRRLCNVWGCVTGHKKWSTGNRTLLKGDCSAQRNGASV